MAQLGKNTQFTCGTKRAAEETLDDRSRKRPDAGKKESKSKIDSKREIVEKKVSSIPPMSPARAMRTEMLKNRFAAIILKAQNQTLLCPGATVMSQYTQKKKTKCCNLQQRQREREAARLALEMVEKSVQFEDNMSAMRDFEQMIGQLSFPQPLRGNMHMEAPYLMKEKLKGLYQCHSRTLPEDYEEGEIIE